jgi:hypothetical protein
MSPRVATGPLPQPPATPALDLGPIKARQRRDAVNYLDRGFHTDPEIDQMRTDRAALIMEIELLRATPAPAPRKWPA